MDKDTINLLYILGVLLACGLIIYFIANRKSGMFESTTTTGYITNQNTQFPWLFNEPYYYDSLYGYGYDYPYPYYINSPWWWGGGGYGTSWYGGSHHGDGGHVGHGGGHHSWGGGGHGGGGHGGGGHGGGGHGGFGGGGGGHGGHH